MDKTKTSKPKPPPPMTVRAFSVQYEGFLHQNAAKADGLVKITDDGQEYLDTAFAECLAQQELSREDLLKLSALAYTMALTMKDDESYDLGGDEIEEEEEEEGEDDGD